ncbi:hypothetical protein [Luteimonas aquatica]|uniref:hypothetical protein n=1 Tax=Luteimonas aquatica TaxID=450364 RepID=UPI001F59840D|nr:hypothetical protein [Luteimonas aquatica]
MTTNHSAALAEICVLQCEMEAMIDALQDSIHAASNGDKRQRDRIYHLSMALQRTIREVGRQAGAI